MTQHRFRLNLNGNSANDLRDQFMDLHRLALNLRSHMDRMDHIHGRNYQTLDHADMAQKADVEEWRAQKEAVSALVEYAMSGAARIIQQREGL